MRRNKTLAFALAASLLVGGTFVGTKALFTTSGTDSISSDLILTTGTIGLTIADDKWVNDNEGNSKTEATIKQDGKTFELVKPGDSFSKEVTIKGTGNLKKEYTVTGGVFDQTKLNENFDIEILVDDELVHKVTGGVSSETTGSSIADEVKASLNTDNSAKIKVTISTNNNLTSNDSDTNKDDEGETFEFDKVFTPLTIKASQTPAK